MNHRTLLTSFIAASLAWSFPTVAFAAKPVGKGKKPAATAGKPGAAKPGPGADASPKAQLAPYINRIDGLLALDQPKGPKAGGFFQQAAGHLAVLRAQFVNRQGKVDSSEAAAFTAAIATCDALTAALDERQKTRGQISANSAVTSSGTLGLRRKDNFSQGTVGPGWVRYADVKEQARRERAHNKKVAMDAAKTDNALSQGSINRWNQRSIELRQQIATLYARIG